MLTMTRSLTLLTLLLFIPLTATAKVEPRNEPVARTTVTVNMIHFSPNMDHESLTLTVRGPGGEVVVQQFDNGKNPSFNIRDVPDPKSPDGVYIYELRLTPRISNSVKEQLKKARKDNDEAAARKIQKDAGIGKPILQSGAFSIRGGAFVSPDIEEPTNPNTAKSGTEDSSGTGGERNLRPGVEDQVIPDDLIVQSSLCVGFDCVDGESFGSDTIRLKENNLRIHFEDTSTSAGFSANDWRIIANDQASGGLSKLSFEDTTGAKTPMTIEAGTPTNSLYVDSTGNIGLGTAAPALDLHASTSDTPAMRFEQNSSGGFTAQTWDVAGNEANFFVRDVTGGSRLPFRIRPGAPTSSIDINSAGNVGIGTASPAKRMHVIDTSGPAIGKTQSIVQGGDGGFGAGLELGSNLTGGTYKTFAKIVADADDAWNTTAGTQDARVSVHTSLNGTLTERLRVSSAGLVTVFGDLTVTGVKNFAVVDPGDSQKSLYYAALEGPEAGTYFRGTARTVGGEAVIELPGVFSRITESERLTVQLTPLGTWGQLFVAEKQPHRIVVRIPPGSNDVEFDYFVQGVRKGYLGYEVQRANNLGKP